MALGFTAIGGVGYLGDRQCRAAAVWEFQEAMRDGRWDEAMKPLGPALSAPRPCSPTLAELGEICPVAPSQRLSRGLHLH